MTGYQASHLPPLIFILSPYFDCPIYLKIQHLASAQIAIPLELPFLLLWTRPPAHSASAQIAVPLELPFLLLWTRPPAHSASAQIAVPLELPFLLLWTRPPAPLAWSNAVSASLLPPSSPNFLPRATPLTCHRHQSDPIISFTFSSPCLRTLYCSDEINEPHLGLCNLHHQLISYSQILANVGARLSSFYFSNMLGFALGLGKDSRENMTPLNSFSHVCCLLPPIRLSAPVSRGSVLCFFVFSLLTSATSMLPLSLLRIASCVIRLTPCFLNTSYLWGSVLSTGSLVAF